MPGPDAAHLLLAGSVFADQQRDVQPAGRRDRPDLPEADQITHSRLHGQPARDLAAHRARAPWYRRKHTVSIADMLTALRHALLAAQYQQGHPDPHTFDLFPDALLSQLNPAA